MANALARYLTEFRLDSSGQTDPHGSGVVAVTRPTEPVVDTAELVRAAEERALRKATEVAQKELEAAIAAERARAAEQIAAERAKWSEEEAGQLSSQFATAFQGLETKVIDSVARVLAPFIPEALRSQMLAEMEAVLLSLLSDKQHTHLRISGPQDMLSVLASRLGAYGASIEFAFNEEPDVRVVANDTIIETQLNAWASRLAEAVRTN